MQVEAIIDRGKLEFIAPLQLKRDVLRVLVTVPDDEIVANAAGATVPPEVIARAQEKLARMEALRNASSLPDEVVPELTEKQIDRIATFELRDEIKGMR